MSIELSPKSRQKSPESWQKPSSRIKLKVKKRKPSKSSYPPDILKVKTSIAQQHGGGKTKRSNPFSCGTEAKRRPSNTNNSSDNRLFKALDNQVNQCFDYVTCDEDKNEILERKSVTSVEEELSNTELTITPQQESPFFPIDWSLKTKARFTSSASFSWASSLKSVEMADCVTNFVRCQNIDISSSSLLNCASKVWIHPSLPWLQLYPRQPTMKKCDDAIASALQSDWLSSFHSLFNLLRCGHCGYFYLCTGQCSMLFIAPSGDREMTAVITPTTKGFRDALEREGIEFSLPHSKSEDSNTCTSDSEEEDDDKENQSDDEEWLESVGLAKDQFPSIDKYTKQQETQIRNKDQQPTSTVMVTGANTLALSNFILNWKSVMSGVPPTLIAPVAFEGATLKSHKISQGIVKHQHDKNMKQLFSLEISGAILPGCLQRICQLIQAKHDAAFTAVLTPYHTTIPLNVTAVDHDLSMLTKAGLTHEEMDHFTATNQRLDKTCLKEIKCSNGLYSWT